MAKKQDPSMNLSYILKKQEEEKLSGLSANVAAQVAAAGGSMPAPSSPSVDRSMLTELKSINNNITKMARAVLDNSGLLKTLLKSKKGPQVGPNYNLTEDKLEDENFKQKLMDLLLGIKEDTDKMAKPKKGIFDDLGKWATALALALGALIGWLQAKLKFLSRFIPENLLTSIAKRFSNLGKFFEDLIAPLKERFGKAFGKIGTFFEQTFGKVKKLLGFDKDIGIFSEIGKALKAFMKPFKTAFKVLRILISGPIKAIEGVFSGIGKFIKTFSGAVGKVASIVKFIGEPILIITALYDTVKGAIEGFKKGGIVGAVKGALKGLFDATIGGFLDLIKDIGSWILDKLGFKEASKFLDSFSFKDLYSKFIDLMFKPIEWMQNMYKSLWDTIKNIQIGPFSIFGKKIGPWKPFASSGNDAQSSDTAKPADTSTPSTATSTTSAPATMTQPTSAPATMTQPTSAPVDVVTPSSVQPADIAPANRQTADVVYNRSGDNAQAAAYPPPPPTSIVNAPTTITKQTSNNLIKLPVRDEDTTIQQYYRSRFAF